MRAPGHGTRPWPEQPASKNNLTTWLQLISAMKYYDPPYRKAVFGKEEESPFLRWTGASP